MSHSLLLPFPTMKLLSLGLALLVATSAQAQVFRPRIDRSGGGHSRGGTTVSVGVHHGGYANHGHWGGSHGHGGYRGYFGPSFSYYPRYIYAPSYAYPVYGYYDGYGAGYPYYGSYGSTSGAASGLLFGALAGGIIGNNSGSLRHDTWRGAAWGAGLGWLLGSIADANRRPAVYAAPAANSVVTAPASMNTAAAATAQPQQVTIINNYYSQSPMSGANSLFGR